MAARHAIGIHGGCGVMARGERSEAAWASARADLADALRAGWSVLRGGGASLDAVQAAVMALEDCPTFNAGYGAVLNAAGEHELDASIMDGARLAAGAVAGARRIRNPVAAARALLDGDKVVMLIGPAADEFAAARGLAMVDPGYFTIERTRRALEVMQAHERDGTAASEAEKHGTVGAVALDRAGHLAAATSTGGFTNKPRGRVGDTPIIGAGTYARDGVCAVSGTGQGELFIRHVLGHEIASRMAYLGEGLETAAKRVVIDDLSRYGAGAGAVTIDASGTVVAPYNTDGMYRGWITPEGDLFVATHADVHFVERLT